MICFNSFLLMASLNNKSLFCFHNYSILRSITTIFCRTRFTSLWSEWILFYWKLCHNFWTKLLYNAPWGNDDRCKSRHRPQTRRGRKNYQRENCCPNALHVEHIDQKIISTTLLIMTRLRMTHKCYTWCCKLELRFHTNF